MSTINFETEGENTIIINIRKGIESMEYMFEGCENLININLTGLNTEKLKSVSGMFSSCTSLVSFNLNLNSSNLENISHLFSDCENLEEINIYNINTSNVIDMSGIFLNCPSLINLIYLILIPAILNL